MRKIVIFISIILFAVSIIPPQAYAAKFYYAGWLPFWKKQSGALDISNNLYKFQELSPFSYEVRSNGTLIDSLKITQGFWPAWLSAITDAGVKDIPTIAWFNGTQIQNILSNRNARIAQENRIARLVKTMGFDGIDIDYESKLSKTENYFSTFLYGLALRLHPMGKILSCTIEARTPLTDLAGPISAVVKRANDYIALNKYCDEVRVMAYDQGLIDIKLDAQKGNGQLYAPVSDPDWAKKTVEEALKYISPKKIMLGIPTYGYEYQVSWSDGHLTYQRLRSLTYFQAILKAMSSGVVQERNSAGEFSFAFGTSTYIGNISPRLTWTVTSTLPAVIAQNNAKGLHTMFVSFTDATSAENAINLAKSMGLRGVAFFKLDGEQDPFLWDKMK